MTGRRHDVVLLAILKSFHAYDLSSRLLNLVFVHASLIEIHGSFLSIDQFSESYVIDG